MHYRVAQDHESSALGSTLEAKRLLVSSTHWAWDLYLSMKSLESEMHFSRELCSVLRASVNALSWKRRPSTSSFSCSASGSSKKAMARSVFSLIVFSEAVHDVNADRHRAEVILSCAEPIGEGVEDALRLLDARHLLLELLDRLLRYKRKVMLQEQDVVAGCDLGRSGTDPAADVGLIQNLLSQDTEALHLLLPAGETLELLLHLTQFGQRAVELSPAVGQPALVQPPLLLQHLQGPVLRLRQAPVGDQLTTHQQGVEQSLALGAVQLQLLELLQSVFQHVHVPLQLSVAAQLLLFLFQPVLKGLEAALVLLVGVHQLLCFAHSPLRTPWRRPVTM
ncbi:hypothetical protein EYF80_036484 [Liparis tanakae]|uniref:Uncharacterized protein n=1 Tax=Liparis tanakae TaxID=230148 RepID=A0A4Z2GJ73_9TELE|nr:hypothetical protein EYF80_036484 [Liparis tanakae]